MEEEIILLNKNNKENLLDNNDRTYKYNQNEISLEQPQFHLKKKNCCEVIFGKLYGGTRFDLTESEVEAYNKLKILTNINYDETNSDHETTLTNLYELAFIRACPTGINSNDWRKLGFQSDNPRTDFRAGGLYSLLVMDYFIRYNLDEFNLIIKQEHFLFALIAIKFTFFYKIYFNLLNNDDFDQKSVFNTSIATYNRIDECSRKELKNFAYLLNTNSNVGYL